MSQEPDNLIGAHIIKTLRDIIREELFDIKLNMATKVDIKAIWEVMATNADLSALPPKRI